MAIEFIAVPVFADEALYRYEGDVLPYDPQAGWAVYDPCEGPCSESVVDGRFVLHWADASNLVNYNYWIAQPPQAPPPTLWVEWRFRSNNPYPSFSYSCDARFSIRYGGMLDGVNMFSDMAASFSGDDAVFGLNPDEFHTYRFESLDGINYWISVDGVIFVVGAMNQPNGYHYLQFSGEGGCDPEQFPTVNEWDFIRFGTISYGEQIVSHDPPGRFLDARQHADLDRFTVTFDSPNYVYLDEVRVKVTGGAAPAVIQTRRRENDEPDTVEIVLDGPLPMGETTYFLFDDGVAANIVTYTFAPGDTDGNGRVNLADMAAFQNCLGAESLSGACLALDLDHNQTLNLADFAIFHMLLAQP